MPIPKTAIDLRARNQHHNAYTRLLEAIVHNHLSPGQRLYDEDLARTFEVPRSAVKTALTELESQWLVRIVPRQGTFVTEFDLGRGIQAAEVLLALTVRAMLGGAQNLTNGDLETLRRYKEVWLRDAHTAREALDQSREDSELYQVFFNAYGNNEVERVRGWVLPYIKRMRHVTATSGPFDEEMSLWQLRKMIDATLEGRIESAVEALWKRPNLLFWRHDQDGPPPYEANYDVTLTRDLVADTIEAAILDGTLVPGEVLPEVDLMAWLNVSHTPIREAISRLADSGLLERQVSRSARVTQLDPAAMHDTLIATGVLVRVAARKAMRRDSRGLAELIRSHLDEYDGRSTPALDVTVGLVGDMYKFAGAQVVAELADRLRPRVRWYMTSSASAQTPEQNRDLVAGILAAVETGDEERVDRTLATIFENLF